MSPVKEPRIKAGQTYFQSQLSHLQGFEPGKASKPLQCPSGMEVTPLRSYGQKRPVLSPFPPPYKTESPEHIQIQTEIKIDRRGLRKKGQLASRGWRPTRSSGVFPALSFLFTQPPLCPGSRCAHPSAMSNFAAQARRCPPSGSRGSICTWWPQALPGPAQTCGACVSNSHRGDIPDATACLCPASSPKKGSLLPSGVPKLTPLQYRRPGEPCSLPQATYACLSHALSQAAPERTLLKDEFHNTSTAMPDLSICESKQHSRNF